jgi:hypothetical protein
MASQKAIDTLKRINELSIDSEIPILHHYIFYYNGRKYTYDRDYIDHKDGSLTGYALGLDRNDYIVSREIFRIEPDGTILQRGVIRSFALSKKIIKEVGKHEHKK